MNKKELWLNLKNYHFNHLVSPNIWDKVTGMFAGADASTKAFASKISRKLNWKNSDAVKAITKYKKFVYLAIVSDFQVTPSKVIDQVWHQHLLFTQAYREFCAEVIHYNLDHHPELIPMADQTGVFNAQYLDTLELYRTEFGVEPPHDIWSVPKFAPLELPQKNYESKKKKVQDTADSGTSYYSYELPLVASFYQELGSDNAGSFTEFGGGDFGGGGADGGWGDAVSADSTDSAGSGSGDGGSGCSSGCGGGGD